MQPTNPVTTTSDAAPPPIPLALFAIGMLAAAEFAFLLSVDVHGWQRPPYWAPVGILLAALALSDRRHWALYSFTGAGVVLISRVALHGQLWLPSIGFSIIETAEAFAALWLLERAGARSLAFDRVPHMLSLIMAAALVPFPGSLVAAWIIPGPFADAWVGWWTANSLGLVLMPPVVVALVALRTKAGRPSIRQVIEGVVAFAGSAGMTQGVAGESFPEILRAPAYVLPFLLWPAFRFGPAGAGASVMLMGGVAFWSAAHGLGPFALVEDATIPARVLRAQGASWTVGLSLLLLASVVAERKRTAAERAALVDELQRALAEIKTLQGMIPICAWCHKIRDDAGFWQGIDMYLDHHTDATFSHSICPDCVERVNLGLPSETAEHHAG